VQIFLGRNHQKHKREATLVARPKRNGIKFFKKRGAKHTAVGKDAELGAVGEHGTETFASNKYEETSAVPTSGGYHTGPIGSAVNPYGYDNKTRHAS
jgi:hypothetical protein